MPSVFDNIGVGDQLGELNCCSRQFERHVARAEEGRDTSSASHRIAALLFRDNRNTGKESSRLLQDSKHVHPRHGWYGLLTGR